MCEQAFAIAVETDFPLLQANTQLQWALALDQLNDRAQAITRAEAALLIYDSIEAAESAKARAALAKWREV